MQDLIRKVEKWVVDRNLQSQSPKEQFCKLMEELGELAKGVNKNNYDLIVDSIGDVQVVLICMCEQLKDKGVPVNYLEALQVAYDEIKDRKGKIIDGVFVKEADFEAMGLDSEGNPTSREVLYKMHVSYGRMGDVEGMFIADPKHIQALCDSGVGIYYGEILGKHSEVIIQHSLSDFKIVTEDKKIIDIVKETGMENGYNPFEIEANDEFVSEHTTLDNDKYWFWGQVFKNIVDNKQ